VYTAVMCVLNLVLSIVILFSYLHALSPRDG
jgi:hypothetical protein